METKFYWGKSLLICVISFFALSSVLTGCTDYDDEIDELNSRVDGLEASFEQLKTSVDVLKNQVNNGGYVSGVQKIENRLIFSFGDGRTPITIDLPSGQTGQQGPQGPQGEPGKDGDEGPTGKDGTIWKISEKGYWIVDNEATDMPAKAAPEPYFNKDGFLVLWKWSEKDTMYIKGDSILFTGGITDGWKAQSPKGYWMNGEIRTGYPAVGAPAPFIDITDNQWITYVWDFKEGNTSCDTMWIQKKTNLFVTDSLNAYVIEVPDADYYEFWVKLKKDATKLEMIPLPKYNPNGGGTTSSGSIELLGFVQLADFKGNLSWSALETDLSLAQYKGIVITAEYGEDEGKEVTWTKGTKSVVKGETLISSSSYVFMRYDGDPGNMTFKLEDSKGGDPLELGKALPYDGLFTKATSTGSLYALPITKINDTPASNAVYRLASAAAKSNYSKTTINVSAGGAIAEVMVEKIGVNDVTNSSATIVADASFNVSFTKAEAGNVYDYYVEAATENNDFSFNKQNGTFKIARGSTTNIDIYVYKLHIDGKIYREPLSLSVVQF